MLTGQRTLVCFADNNNTCLDRYNDSYTRLLFSDEKYVSDAYGNPAQVKRYTGYGYSTRSQRDQRAGQRRRAAQHGHV